jgi:hypothetical protein
MEWRPRLERSSQWSRIGPSRSEYCVWERITNPEDTDHGWGIRQGRSRETAGEGEHDRVAMPINGSQPNAIAAALAAYRVWCRRDRGVPEVGDIRRSSAIRRR